MNHKPHFLLQTAETEGTALFSQVKQLLMDNEAAQYFVKLHIIAGQMNTECMNNTDTFYTLTGKSGEIFRSDKVRISPILTPRTKLSTEATPTAISLFVFGGRERLQRTSFLIPCLAKHFSV